MMVLLKSVLLTGLVWEGWGGVKTNTRNDVKEEERKEREGKGGRQNGVA